MVKAHLPHSSFLFPCPSFLVPPSLSEVVSTTSPPKIKKDKHPFSTKIIYGKD